MLLRVGSLQEKLEALPLIDSVTVHVDAIHGGTCTLHSGCGLPSKTSPEPHRPT